MNTNFLVLNVGATGTGKTTQTKKLIESIKVKDKKRKIYIYDVNKEFTEYYSSNFVGFDEFSLLIKGLKNSLIVVEEASIFFETRQTNEIIKELLIKKRHDNNNIILNFHSFAMIPNYIFHLTDYVTVFKTNDSINKIKSKFDNEKLLFAVDEIKKSTDKYVNLVVKLY